MITWTLREKVTTLYRFRSLIVLNDHDQRISATGLRAANVDVLAQQQLSTATIKAKVAFFKIAAPASPRHHFRQQKLLNATDIPKP